MNRSGDNLEASIILANNPISMGHVKEFVTNKYQILVETFLMDTNFNKDTAAKNGDPAITASAIAPRVSEVVHSRL